MRLLEGRETGQDDMGVARGLVQSSCRPQIMQSRDGERLVELPRVGCADDGVARERDERLDLPWARSRDLLGEAGYRKLSEHFGCAAHAAVPAPEFEAARELRVGQAHERPRDRVREHHPSGLVEVAGEDIHHVDEPGRQRPELLITSADSPVHRGGGRGRDLARQAANSCRPESGTWRPRPRAGSPRTSALRPQPHSSRLRGARVSTSPFGKQHLHDRHQQRCVGPRLDRNPLVRMIHRTRAPRIYDHHLAAACAYGIHAAQDVGGGRAGSPGKRADWRPSRRSSRCDRCRAPECATCPRTGARPRRSSATGRRCPPNRCSVCPDIATYAAM